MPDNLYRIDTPNTHGWQFRKFYNGQQLSKLFSDKKFGGKEQSFQAARDYRDEILAGLRRYRFRKTPQSNNSTGYSGVSVTHELRKGTKVRVYQVHWVDQVGKRHNKRFFVHKYHTDRLALQAAVDFRTEKINDAMVDALRGSKF
ncbi:MAG: hypothetical protein ABIA75_06170, partial [Candidatus Neomarinimicrobiota bacterium]